MEPVYEANFTVINSEDLHYAVAHEEVGKVVSKIMLHHPDLKQLHQEVKNKLYVFSNLSPIEKDGVYKKGNVYKFCVRSNKKELLEKFQMATRSLIPSAQDLIYVLHVEIRKNRTSMIQTLYTLNPLIVTVDSGPWKLEHGLLLLQNRIQANAEKKYSDVTGKSLKNSPSFIEHVEILTEKPYAYRYKGMKLLGHKLRVVIRTDEISQGLATVVLGSGMGEKGSSLGAGFCQAAYL